MSLPTIDQNLDLAQLLRLELPAAFPALGSGLSSEEERQLAEAQTRILSSLVISDDARTRSSFFSSSLTVIEDFIKGVRARSAMLMFGIAFALFIVVDKKLFRRVYGCATKEEYFLRTSLSDLFSPTTLYNLAIQGGVFEDYRWVLMTGSYGIPGFTLQFIAENRTKLMDFPEAVSRHEPKEALLHFRDDTVRDFSKWTKYEAPIQLPGAGAISAQDTPEPSPEDAAKAASEAEKAQAISKARKEQAKARAANRLKIAKERQAAIDAEVALFSDDDRFIVRTLQSNMVPYIAMPPVGHPDFLDTIEGGLIAHRERQNREIAAHLRHEAFDPADPVSLADGLGDLVNVFDIEDRIRAANALVTEGKRIVYISFHRLYNDADLVKQWKSLGFLSFQKYTEAHLGVGPECYEYVKIGRALLQYRYLLAELPNRDTDALFAKLPYLEAALQGRKGDYIAVRHALITLSADDFKAYSKATDFAQQQFSRPVTQAQLDQVYSYRSMMTHYRTYGRVEAMKLVAVLDRDESRVVHWIFRDLEKELAADARKMPASNETASTEEAAMDAEAPTHDADHAEAHEADTVTA